MVKIYHAMGDGTRMGVVQALARGPRSVSELSRNADMAMPSFLQHLAILEACGLVRSEKKGRVRTCELVPETLSAAHQWIETVRTDWQARLDNLEAHVTEAPSSRKDD